MCLRRGRIVPFLIPLSSKSFKTTVSTGVSFSPPLILCISSLLQGRKEQESLAWNRTYDNLAAAIQPSANQSRTLAARTGEAAQLPHYLCPVPTSSRQRSCSSLDTMMCSLLTPCATGALPPFRPRALDRIFSLVAPVTTKASFSST